MSDVRAGILASLVPVMPEGVDLEDVEITKAGRRQLVRVIVDRDGGVDLDLIAAVSQAVSEALDAPSVEALLGDAYVLEVTSPGVDRPLVSPTQWRRAVGRLVESQCADGTSVVGRLTASNDTEITLQPVKGEPVTIARENLVRGIVQIEFSKPETE